LYNGINGSENYFVNGSFPAYYGFSFSPFPQQYGGFLLEVKYGGSSFIFYGDYSAKQLSKYGEEEELLFNTRKNLSIELSFKPCKLFSRKILPLMYVKNAKDLLNFIVISFYYERFSMKGATFNNQPLSNFVAQNFIDKYSNRNYFGIKLGIGVY
jgi:hypothetical protein